jgi:hypothetical protein
MGSDSSHRPEGSTARERAAQRGRRTASGSGLPERSDLLGRQALDPLHNQHHRVVAVGRSTIPDWQWPCRVGRPMFTAGTRPDFWIMVASRRLPERDGENAAQ